MLHNQLYSIPMAHRLNTNKQFMIGNMILAFAVIFVVVIFVYMSLRLQQQKQAERHFIEQYSVELAADLAGDSLALMVNDSLLMEQTLGTEPVSIRFGRFAEQSTLMVVDKASDRVQLFELDEQGGDYLLRKTDGQLELKPREN